MSFFPFEFENIPQPNWLWQFGIFQGKISAECADMGKSFTQKIRRSSTRDPLFLAARKPAVPNSDDWMPYRKVARQ
jgi:hypothetical protein